MKKTNRLLALVLVLMMVLPMFTIFADAAAGQTWTVAGVKALCGTDWNTGDKNNDMTYDAATDSYVKVYTNVKAGNYQFKCAKDHKWNVAYPGSNYNLKVAKDGSTVTITLKGKTVTAKVEAPACDHAYEVTAATVTCLTGGSRTWTCSKCQDSYTEEKLDALGHYYDEAGKCIRCDATTEFVRVYVDNAAKWTEVYCYTWDTNPYVAWPGEKLTLTTEDGLFYYDIPKHFVNVIFNNGGSTQSADLKTPTGTATIYNNSTKTWKAPHVHAYSDPTCTEPGKCSCGLTQGEALGHQWTDATYFAPKTCSVCGATEGEALVAVAQIGETRYGTFEEAFAALEEGGTITLLSTYVVGKGTTLLNNITIEASADFYPAIRVIDGGFVVMNNVTLKTGDYGVVLGAADGSSDGVLHIYSGKFECGTTVVSVTKGELVIKDGEFSATPYEGNYAYLLNCIDANYADGSAVIKVVGGTFHNWNPADNAAEGVNTNFVVEGYVSEDNGDGTWTVSKYVPACEHVWSDATCTAPKTCSVCGATDGEAAGHTPGAEATCTTAQTCTVCGAELAPMLEHVDANLDITCDYEGCTKRILPPADSKVSLFTANHMIIVSLSNNYYVEGVVTEVVDAKNGNFIITDEAGDQLYIRMPVDAEGVKHSAWQMKVVVGDVVSLYGKPKSTSGWNTSLKAGMESAVLTFIDQHEHVAKGETICTKDTLCACGAVVIPATGHIDADENGICDNCPWDMNLVEVNIAIGTDPKYNGVRVDNEAGKALSWTWSAGGFDAVIAKGTSTVTLYTTAKDYMQLKKLNTLTIVNSEDVKVQYVVISVTNANYLKNLKDAIATQFEYTADEVNFTVTIQVNSAEDIVLVNKGTNTVYINGVSIVYAKKGAHVHEFKETITTPATCTEAGLKTFTCECGEDTYTEEIKALGHDFAEGVCTRCEEKDPNYVPPCAHKDAGLDAKCDVCGEYFLPTSPFKLEMYQATKKETYYFTGAMSGYYFATSTDITKAVDLYAEAVEGGYNVYFMSGSTKNYLYIQLSGTHINAKFGTTKAVWYVDETYGCLTTEVSGTKYFLGTYSTYVTFGGTAYSRLNASTADVSQYVGRAVSLEEHECTNTTPTVTDPTCTAQGYTTYKCADCGLSTKGNYVDALGHDMVTDEAVAPTCTETGLTAGEHCSRCDHKVAQETVDALGHDMVTDEAVAPTCTETGLTAGEHCSRCDHKVAQEVVDALGHDFVEGKCECGAEDPDYVAPQPPVEEPELNFFQKIIAWLVELLNKFLAIFKK